uniref:Uncharacterized protein n=1 Tax=Catagonus wagneri TaxID=51154 RepID=A0A8C3YN99_9CETA
MYMGPGEESLLLKCLKPRTRASRDTVLPVPAWPTFPQRSLVSCSSFSERIKELAVLIKQKARLHHSNHSKRQRITRRNDLYFNSPNLPSQIDTHTHAHTHTL